ncbi:MAG: hypothetical protein GY795_38715, partial [Desulfobacterales bacterium]|nr:hypothetical protein [Desulfobacterales bacterium]
MKTAPGKVSNKKSQKKQREKNKRNIKNLVFRLCKTLLHCFPDISDRIKDTEDCRRKKDYELTEPVAAAVMMFLPKKESRNASGNEREEEEFQQNCERIFKVRFPRTDTADNVMRELKEREPERLKTVPVKNLLKKKTFHRYRMAGYHRTAADGTHVMTVNEGHCENCLHRTSETGKMTYFHNVLEAELVTGNGFSVSLGTER